MEISQASPVTDPGLGRAEGKRESRSQLRHYQPERFPFYIYSFLHFALLYIDHYCFLISRPSQWPTDPPCRLTLTPHPQLPPQSCAPRHTRKPPNFTSHDAYQKLSQISNHLLRLQNQKTSTQMAISQHRLRRSPRPLARGGSRCGTSTSPSSAQ